MVIISSCVLPSFPFSSDYESSLQVAVLSTKCSEEAKKVNDALEREELLKLIVADEKAKRLEAVKEVEKARQLISKEALDRHKAEMVASTMSLEKLKVLDSLFSNGKCCRRYSMNEIEVATDNFSEAKKIGEGSYGKVYKCTLDHTPVAIKVLCQETRGKMEEFIREVFLRNFVLLMLSLLSFPLNVCLCR